MRDTAVVGGLVSEVVVHLVEPAVERLTTVVVYPQLCITITPPHDQ
jgi:hypothetical protein